MKSASTTSGEALIETSRISLERHGVVYSSLFPAENDRDDILIYSQHSVNLPGPTRVCTSRLAFGMSLSLDAA